MKQHLDAQALRTQPYYWQPGDRAKYEYIVHRQPTCSCLFIHDWVPAIRLIIGEGAGKFSGVRRIFTQISPNLAERFLCDFCSQIFSHEDYEDLSWCYVRKRSLCVFLKTRQWLHTGQALVLELDCSRSFVVRFLEQIFHRLSGIEYEGWLEQRVERNHIITIYFYLMFLLVKHPGLQPGGNGEIAHRNFKSIFNC